MEERSWIPWATLLDKNMVQAFHEAHPEKTGGRREAPVGGGSTVTVWMISRTPITSFCFSLFVLSFSLSLVRTHCGLTPSAHAPRRKKHLSLASVSSIQSRERLLFLSGSLHDSH